MRHRANRLLHVLLCAPVAVILAVATAQPGHAQTVVVSPGAVVPLAAATPHPGATSPAPRPYTVVLDAGHGGSPDNAHPDQPYDSGAVATNGLLEKDLTLDMVDRVRPLLESLGVHVVLTRSTDVSMDITPRMQKALDVSADLFVSIHFNGWTDPAAAGSLILYPKDFCQPFATTMANALARRLGPFGVLPDGLQFRPEMFQQAAMPTATLEPLFLTNPTEAALMTRTDVRDAIARAVVDGVVAQAGDQIGQRRALAAQWGLMARVIGGDPIGAPSEAPAVALDTAPLRTASTPASGLAVAPIALVMLSMAMIVVLRRPLFHATARVSARMLAGVARLEGTEVPAIARLDSGGRRRQARRRALLERSRSRSGSERLPLYDELFFRPRARSTRR